MILTDRAEEILETLWIEIFERKTNGCDAAILKDNEALKELIHFSLVELKNNQIRLTEKGQVEARNCVRRHRLAERLLVDVLDVKEKNLHEASCQFEHLLHKGIDESICTLLGHPKTCPHGKTIPEGPCCKDIKKAPKKVIMPLSDLKVKQKAKISYLQTQDKSAIQKMIAMGLLPKTDIELIQKFPSYVFRVGKTRFAIDKELASQIFVRII